MSISIDKAVIARLQKGEEKFEILVDPKLAFELKKGEDVRIEDVLAYPAIYKDARKGEVVSKESLVKAFGSTDVYQIAKKILMEGEFQLTTQQKRELIEQKKMQIANIIARRGVNPQTNTPHPPQRIINAMEEVGVNVDPFMDAELQVERVLKEIKKVLPIKVGRVEIEVKIPAQYSGKVYSIIRKFGEPKSEQWLNDGSLKVVIELAAGMQQSFFDKISSLTHGNFESRVLGEKE